MNHKISVVANTFIKQMELGPHEAMPGHAHTYDHQTLLALGSVVAEVEGQEEPKVYNAPAILVVTKGKRHHFTAQETGALLYCIHALRKQDGTEDIFDPEDRPSLNEAMPLTKKTM